MGHPHFQTTQPPDFPSWINKRETRTKHVGRNTQTQATEGKSPIEQLVKIRESPLYVTPTQRHQNSIREKKVQYNNSLQTNNHPQYKQT